MVRFALRLELSENQRLHSTRRSSPKYSIPSTITQNVGLRRDGFDYGGVSDIRGYESRLKVQIPTTFSKIDLPQKRIGSQWYLASVSREIPTETNN